MISIKNDLLFENIFQGKTQDSRSDSEEDSDEDIDDVDIPRNGEDDDDKNLHDSTKAVNDENIKTQ